MLACIGGIADANNGILFLKAGGHVIQLNPKVLELIKQMLEASDVATPFDRRGMVYVMDACVAIPKGSVLESKVMQAKGFQGQER